MYFLIICIGSPCYWFKQTKQLEALLEQKGAATVFCSYSMADAYWPELHRLLGTENKGIAERKRAINNNPHIVMSYFVLKMTDFVHYFFENCLKAEWVWWRCENQGRGTIHAHLMAKLGNDPDLIKLTEAILEGRKAKVKLNCNNYTTVTEQKELEQIARDGDVANERVISYIDTLISTNNPLSFDEIDHFIVGHGLDHVCSKDIMQILDDREAMDQDYIDLINSVQRHKNHTSYCRKYKSGVMFCRFGFPFKAPEPDSYLKFTRKKDGGYKTEVITQRNDPVLNKHNRTTMQAFRSNTDMQPVLDWRACLGYISKYAAKAEKRSATINELLSKVLSGLNRANTVETAFRKMMIATVASKDYSHQEVMQLLFTKHYSLVHCKKFKFVDCNLKFDHKIMRNFEVIPTVLELYGDRKLHSVDENGELNLHSFWITYEYNCKKKVIVPRMSSQEVIVYYYPRFSKNKKHKTFLQYVQQQLVKYRPWIDDYSNAWRGCLDPDNVDVLYQFYLRFLQSEWAQDNLPHFVLHEAQVNSIELEEDEIAFVETTDEVDPLSSWQMLSAMIDRHPNIDAEFHSYDWQIEAELHANIKDRLESHLAEVRSWEPDGNEDANNEEFNVNQLTAGQELAYFVLKGFCF